MEPEKPNVLGLGIEGGFIDKSRNFDYEYNNQIVILPENLLIPLPNNDIPLKVQQAVDAILAIESASMKKAVDSFLITEERQISKYAFDLLQIDNGVKIPRSGWKCAKCDLTENLWLNLTDGMILCGRKIHGGLGGNGHALQHYEETKYPLVVKLGTITPDGNADVFSYAPDENDMVIDPKLDEHLKHFGIDMSEMKKTEQTLAEMEIAYQFSFDWNRISEGDKELKPLYGPGYTGMFNLGNTCYMASIMQVLASLPEFSERYYNQDYFIEKAKKDPPVDFFIQLSKLYKGLLSGKHSFEEKKQSVKEDDDDFPRFTENGISPKMFKALVGHNHPEFGSNRQQDASEFYQYILQMIDRNEHAIGETNNNPTRYLKFKLEDRIQCLKSMKVRYTSRVDNLLSLPIPIEKAKNFNEYSAYLEIQSKKTKEELEQEKKDRVEPVRPIVSLVDCFEAFVAPEQLENYYSTAVKDNTTAVKTTKLLTMPKYLMIQMRKFDLSSGWVPKKLDVLIDAPEEINLENYRSQGKLPNEEELPIEENDKEQETVMPQWDESVVQMLTAMDIPLVRAQRASMATKGDVNEAMEWLFSHLDDPDIDKPIEPVINSNKSDIPNENMISMVSEMGFTREQAIIALKKTNNELERAIDYLFSHDNIEEDDDSNQPIKEELISDDGEGNYELCAFITHIGMSTMSGHYVCHIKKDGKWVNFNDEKVAESQSPPKEMAYLYLYRRK